METEAQDAAASAASEPAAELADANARAERYYNEYLYAQAEIENIKKRTQRQIEERVSLGKRSTLGKFLPVLDNLQRALGFDDSSGLRGGLQATLRSFETLLGSESVRPLDVVGKPFDPRVAEAIATRESSEHDDDVVIEEAQRGYLLGDELLRPALVVVAKRVPPAESDDAGETHPTV